MEKTLLGECDCPVCKAPDAEVRTDKNGRAYVKCESCVTMIRTMSRVGDRAMRAMVKKSNTPPAKGESVPPVNEPRAQAHLDDKPAAPATVGAKKKRGVFADALSALSGGD